ncbi:uncharacterized protein [Venturia canescens]|uniref:uncharacterized protein n=1 Tax=Venturia canescens TaxID=32260 RepID=UPI001C9C06DA|nr:uncharacterized protein LOC122407977 [Venturia canescens]
MIVLGTITSMDVFFYANACYVCRVYGEKVNLKRCSACKMISYCSPEHQRYHWAHHKEFCQVLSNHLKEKGTLYRTDLNLENEEVWKSERAKLIGFVEFKLRRKLLFHEMLMLHFPRSCEICHETKPQKLSNCNVCPSASFCNKHPKDHKHSVLCKKLKLAYETDITSSFAHCVPESDYKSIPLNMIQAIKLYKPSSNNEFFIQPDEKVWACRISEIITRPYTVLWSMEKLSLPKSLKMTIHIVGSMGDDINQISYWQHMIRHLNHLEELNIVFVGLHPNTDCNSARTISDRQVNNIRLNFQFVRESYADFATSQSFMKPDYVVGFHLGTFELPGPENHIWTSNLKMIGKLGCPFSVTSGPDWKVNLERQRINEIFGRSFAFYQRPGKPRFVRNDFKITSGSNRVPLVPQKRGTRTRHQSCCWFVKCCWFFKVHSRRICTKLTCIYNPKYE